MTPPPFKYPISETFYSVQGEGRFTGTPMYFVRTAQCPVGKVAGICTTWSGQSFICDTGASYKGKMPGVEWHSYNEVNARLTAEEIWQLAIDSHDCRRLMLTGGEPLVYPLEPLLTSRPRRATIHIETSGVADQSDLIAHYENEFWVALSPKKGCLPGMVSVADEIKLLVGVDTTQEELESWYQQNKYVWKQDCPILLQPIEDPSLDVWKEAQLRALTFALEQPERYRLATQVHKQINVR